MIARSLRSKLAIAFALFGTLVIAAHAFAVFLVSEDQQEDFINQLVEQEMDYLIDAYRRGGGFALTHSKKVRSYVMGPENAAGEIPVYLRGLSIGLHEVFVGDRELHVEVRRADGRLFYVAYDVTSHERQVAQFGWFLLFGVLLTGALISWLAYWLSGILAGQVADLAAQVKSRGPSHPVSPLAARYRDEEVVELAAAFDEYQSRVETVLARERDFTADASHELRTPLTSIQTGCELLLEDPSLSGKQRDRIERIAAAAARLAAMMESLLFLARDVQDPRPDERLNLHEFISDWMRVHGDWARAKGIELSNAVAAETFVETNAVALGIVMGNLLTNAVNHTPAGKVEVGWKASCLTISDTGAGIAPEHLPRVFERHFRGADTPQDGGQGIGLAIVRRICERQGWQIRIESKQGQGTTVSVCL